MENSSDFLLANKRIVNKSTNQSFILGRERATKYLYPTLTKDQPEDDAWGFSALVGLDAGPNLAHWSGIVAYRSDKGLWMRIESIRQGTPAERAGLKSRDIVTRINGQIVYHLTVKDVERLINQSGDKLLFDIERDNAKSMLYGSGVHAKHLNFLYEDYAPSFYAYKCIIEKSKR